MAKCRYQYTNKMVLFAIFPTSGKILTIFFFCPKVYGEQEHNYDNHAAGGAKEERFIFPH